MTYKIHVSLLTASLVSRETYILKHTQENNYPTNDPLLLVHDTHHQTLEYVRRLGSHT